MSIKTIIQSNLKTILTLLTILASLALFLYYFSPKEILDLIGVENSYLAVFLIASFGGLSMFTSAALYSAIATFASGGADPFWLGILGGLGIAIGDTIIFLLLKYGYNKTEVKNQEKLKKYKDKLESLSPLLQYLTLYIILGLTPVPNDIIMAILVFLGFKLRKVLPVLIVAGITIALITAYTGKTILESIFNF